LFLFKNILSNVKIHGATFRMDEEVNGWCKCCVLEAMVFL